MGGNELSSLDETGHRGKGNPFPRKLIKKRRKKMKKSIKRLSAILAILVLSMTLAVPVTAVEYEDEMMPYAITRIYHTDLSYSENGYEVLRGSFNIAYDYATDTLYVSCTSYATEDATEFVGFESNLVGHTAHEGGVHHYFEDVSEGFSLEDETNAVYSEDVTSAFLFVSAAGCINWGGVDVDGDSVRLTADNDIWQ